MSEHPVDEMTKRIAVLRNDVMILRKQVIYMEQILTMVWEHGCEPEAANVQSALNPIWKAGLSEE